jgi:hypothetical protein
MSKTRLFEAVKTLDLDADEENPRGQARAAEGLERSGRNLLHMACSVDCTETRQARSASAANGGFLLDAGFDLEEKAAPVPIYASRSGSPSRRAATSPSSNCCSVAARSRRASMPPAGGKTSRF